MVWNLKHAGWGGPVSVKSFQGNTHVLVKEFKGKESAFVIQWHGKIIFTS